MDENTGSPHVTLRDIAKRLGISHSAVSMALHNSPQISVELQKKVQKTAHEMGYQPNAMATALGLQRYPFRKMSVSAEIAWINYWRSPEKLRGYREFDLYWKGAYQAAEQSGFRLEEFTCANFVSSTQLEKILRARNIHGILIPPHPKALGIKDWSLFHWENFCTVRFGYSLAYPPVDIVTSNQLTIGMLAFDNISRLGYKRIGFVSSETMSTYFKAGFLMRQGDFNKKDRISPLILPAAMDLATTSKFTLFIDWLKKSHPDAILTDVREMREMLEKLGYQIPQDIGLAAISILDGNADAGIYQNSDEIGRVASNVLIGMLNRNQYGIPKMFHETLIPGKWVDGTTLPPRS